MGKKKSGQKHPPQKQKSGLSPKVKWVFLLCLAPVLTLFAELISGICGGFWSISCTGVLAASVGLAIASMADVLPAAHPEKSNYAFYIASAGAASLVTFSVMLFPEMQNAIKWQHIALTTVVVVGNAICCLRLTYIVDVRSKQTV